VCARVAQIAGHLTVPASVGGPNGNFQRADVTGALRAAAATGGKLEVSFMILRPFRFDSSPLRTATNAPPADSLAHAHVTFDTADASGRGDVLLLLFVSVGFEESRCLAGGICASSSLGMESAAAPSHGANAHRPNVLCPALLPCL
jgi:hypothetical protein